MKRWKRGRTNTRPRPFGEIERGEKPRNSNDSYGRLGVDFRNLRGESRCRSFAENAPLFGGFDRWRTLQKRYISLTPDRFGGNGGYGAIYLRCLRNSRNIGARKCQTCGTLVAPFPFLSFLSLSGLSFFCLVLSWPVLTFPVLSCLRSSCLVFACRVLAGRVLFSRHVFAFLLV